MALVNSFINVFFEKVPLEVFSIRSHFIIIFLTLFFIARIRRKKIHCRKTAWKRPKTARIAGEKRRRSFPPRHAARKRWSEINGFSRFTPEMKRCASVWPFFIVLGTVKAFSGTLFSTWGWLCTRIFSKFSVIHWVWAKKTVENCDGPIFAYIDPSFSSLLMAVNRSFILNLWWYDVR